jgi:hypothetical protein
MSQFRLLGTERFLPLFFTQFLGAFNDNVYKNALVIYVAFTAADSMHLNSSIMVILAGGIFILPFFLFSATAGQLADRFEKAMLIRCIKSAEIAIMSMAAAGFFLGDLVLLMTALFLMGTHSTFFGPLKYGILPQHLSESELTGGNGLIQMATYLAILTGTMLGGVLVAMEQNGPLIVSGVAVLIACAGRLASAWIPPAAPVDPGLRVDPNFLWQTVVILKRAFANRFIGLALVAISWFWFAGATFLSLVPTFTRDVVTGDERVATLLLTAFSVGIGLGSVLCERLSREKIEPGLVPFGALGIGVFAIDLFLANAAGSPAGQSHTVSQFLAGAGNWRILLDLSLIGFCGGIYIVPLYALLQIRAETAFRSRMIAANNIVNALFMVVSALLTIFLIRLGMAPQDIFALTGLATFAITGAVFLAWPEFLQRSGVLLNLRGIAEKAPD